MAEVYSRYSAKAPEPLSAQFNDRIDKQSAVKAYNEKCGKGRNIPLFPSGISLSRFRCCFVLIFASHNSLLGNLVKKAILFTWCCCNLDTSCIVITDQPLCFQVSLCFGNVLIYLSLSLSLFQIGKEKKNVMTDHRLERSLLTNLFTNVCAVSEQDILQQDAATAVETETVTGSRTTRKCSKCKRPGHTRRNCPMWMGWTSE